jgi:RNA polymerase sigma factor (sigma-70 family)
MDRLAEKLDPWVRNNVKGRLPDWAKARYGESDLGQDLSIFWLTTLPDYSGESDGQFLAWLDLVCRRKAIDMIRYITRAKRNILRQRPLQEGSTAAAGGGVADPLNETASKIAMRDEDAEPVRAAIARLPEEEKTVVILRAYDELSYEVIATIFERSVEALRALHHRALIRLRKELP